MGEGRSWLESRHLTRSPDGARALERLAGLPRARAASILCGGDEFAEVSVTLAHRFFVSAVTLECERPERYPWWAELVTRPLRLESGGRTVIQALLDLDPLPLAAVEPETADTWRSAVWRLSATSGRVAAAYARGVGGALAESSSGPIPPPGTSDLWANAVARVAQEGGWRGELLAGHVAESAASLFNVFDAAAIDAWAALVVRVGSAGRSPRAPVFPPIARELSPWMHAPLLRLALAAAAERPQGAEALLAVLCDATVVLAEPTARKFLAIVARVASTRELESAVALLPAVTHELDTAELDIAMTAGLHVAERLPEAVPAFLRKMGQALEIGGSRGFTAWVERGNEIGVTSPAAGLAHFQLETRTAHKLLSGHGAAATFEELEGIVQRYLRMIARRPVRAVAGPGLWLVPPIEPTDAGTVRLPERVDLFRTVEDNQAFYLLSATHAAARWQYGTFDFRRAEYRGRVSHALAGDVEAEGLIGFLDGFPNPLLAVGLFQMLDGIRIESRLTHDFPGLRADMQRIGSRYAADGEHVAAEGLSEEMIEALFLVSIGKIAPERLPLRLARHRPVIESVLDRLARPSADVYDSAELMEKLYWSLTQATMHAGDGDFDAVIELGGATAIDPLEHLDGGPAPKPHGGDAEPVAKFVGPDDPAVHELELELSQGEDLATEGGFPLTPEEIRDLIERGVDLRITPGSASTTPSLGLYITDLLGKLPREAREALEQALAASDSAAVRAWLSSQRGSRCFHYDEWDYAVGDYRRRWCQLREVNIDGDGGSFFGEALARSREIVDSIRREFRMMRPEQFRKVRGMQHGDDFDLNALVDAHADRRSRKNPSERLYLARLREERDVATLFLIDMSASTDEPLAPSASTVEGEPTRRVIDVAKETLALMSFVLDDIGDAYAIYGFSGHGRSNVEFYRAKSFSDTLSSEVKSRLGGIQPKRSTRMGTALRHAATKIGAVSAKARHLILLSDGFPQDYDYGDDRTSNVYGLRDTMVALQELEAQGVRTFCITVDPAGHDYLGEMCPETRYAVIDDVTDLPVELPRIYRTVTRL